MIRRHNTALRLSLLAVDALSAFALFVVISIAQFGPTWAAAWRSAGFDPFAIASVYSAVWVAALWIHDLYRLRARWSIRSEFRDVVRADLLIAVATFSALFLFKLPDVSRRFLITLFVLQIVVTMASRISLRLGLGALRDRGYNRRFMLIVGTGDGARRFAERVERRRELGLMVIGHLGVAGASGEDGAMAMVGSRPVLGTVEEIEDILHSRIVDEVAICLTAENAALVEPITRLCEEEGRIVRIPLGELGVTLPGGRVEEFDGGLVLSLVYGPDRALALVGKRLLDIGLGALALVVLAPVMAIVAVIVRAVDGGPVIFRQTRVGLNGRPFRVTKFRTMQPDAEVRLEDLQAQNEIRGPAFKLTDDPRMTRTGTTPPGDQPRRAAADLERAPRRDEPGRATAAAAARGRRVRPVASTPPLDEAGDHRGSGRSRADARRTSTAGSELDLAYIDRWSIWLDVKIMARTIPAMFQGR